MNDASKWKEEDLLLLIKNSVQESIQLDYKSCGSLENTDRKKTEISKDVSALANSAGGVIIYGIVENGHIPESLDEGYNPNETTKEWLEQIINSRIQRKIDGVHINPIELTTTNPGKVAYVVIVPQSSRAPHQAFDKKFYKRYNFESVPMEEYEIRDVSNRNNGPMLSIDFRIEDISKIMIGGGEKEKEVRRLKLMPMIKNESPVPAEYITINIYIDKSVRKLGNNAELSKQDNIKLIVHGEESNCYRLHMNHAIPNKIPVFEGSKFRLLKSPIIIDIDKDGDYYLAYSLIAPYMNEVFEAEVLEIKGALIVSHPVSTGETD